MDPKSASQLICLTPDRTVEPLQPIFHPQPDPGCTQPSCSPRAVTRDQLNGHGRPMKASDGRWHTLDLSVSSWGENFLVCQSGAEMSFSKKKKNWLEKYAMLRQNLDPYFIGSAVDDGFFYVMSESVIWGRRCRISLWYWLTNRQPPPRCPAAPFFFFSLLRTAASCQTERSVRWTWPCWSLQGHISTKQNPVHSTEMPAAYLKQLTWLDRFQWDKDVGQRCLWEPGRAGVARGKDGGQGA